MLMIRLILRDSRWREMSFSLSKAVILTICIKTDLPVGGRKNSAGVDELLEWTGKLVENYIFHFQHLSSGQNRPASGTRSRGAH